MSHGRATAKHHILLPFVQELGLARPVGDAGLLAEQPQSFVDILVGVRATRDRIEVVSAG